MVQMSSDNPIAKFENVYSRLTRTLANYVPESFVAFTTRRLRKIEQKHPSEYRGHYPWNYLLLLKLVWIYGDHFPYKAISEAGLNSLLGELFELGEIKSPFLVEPNINGIFKFLRTTANQQFWLQRGIGKWNIARQYIMLRDLPENNLVRITVRQDLGLDVLQIFQYLFLIWSWLRLTPDNYQFLPDSIFQNLDFEQSSIDSFLEIVSLNSANVKQYLIQNAPVRSQYLQTFEKSPFIMKPILKLKNGSFLCYSEKVMQQTINTFIYHSINKIGGSRPKEAFAEMLEGYIAKGLESFKIPFIRETELKKLFLRTKVTDLLIEDESCNLLIEIKSHEIGEDVRVYPANTQLSHELQDNVTKAVKQAYELLTAIHSSSMQKSTKTNYLIVITYTQFNMGPGRQIFDEFLYKEINPFLQQKSIDQNLLLPEHIFVLDIEEWDMLVSLVGSNKANFSQILEKAVENNSKGNTMKFHFGQHLNEFIGDNESFPLLDEGFGAISGSLLSHFKIV